MKCMSTHCSMYISHLLDGDRSVCCGVYGNGPIRIRYLNCEFRLMDCGFRYIFEPVIIGVSSVAMVS